MAQKYNKAVLVTDHTKVVFYAKLTEPVILPFNDGQAMILPGVYVVWLAYDGPVWTDYSEKEFSELYVTEENLPAHLADSLKDFGSYEDWCDSLEPEAVNA